MSVWLPEQILTDLPTSWDESDAVVSVLHVYKRLGVFYLYNWYPPDNVPQYVPHTVSQVWNLDFYSRLFLLKTPQTTISVSISHTVRWFRSCWKHTLRVHVSPSFVPILLINKFSNYSIKFIDLPSPLELKMFSCMDRKKAGSVNGILHDFHGCFEKVQQLFQRNIKNNKLKHRCEMLTTIILSFFVLFLRLYKIYLQNRKVV